MNEVIYPARFHARARSISAGVNAPSSAKASKVISRMPRSEAIWESGSQYADGMPRQRQQLTVEADKESSEATSVVPPSSLMTKSGVIMPPKLVCAVQTCQVFATGKTTFSPKSDVMGSMMDPPEIISGRLRALRQELGYKTQTSFATKLGIDKSTYNLYETGKRPLTFETACLIRREFGISIDWLFFGDMQQSALQTMARIGRGPEPIPEKVRKAVRK